MKIDTELIKERIISFFILIFTLGMYPLFIREVHSYMTRSCSYITGYKLTTFSKFEHDAQFIEWETNSRFPNSLFSKDYYWKFTGKPKSKLHASMIHINNYGYLLTTYGFWKANRWRKNKIKELNNKL